MGLGGRASLKIRPATILVAKGPDAGRQARIEPLTFVVGVGESADLRLTDSGVAREHLRMILGPDGLHIRDEGSKGGTFVSGIRVRDLTVTSDAVVVIVAPVRWKTRPTGGRIDRDVFAIAIRINDLLDFPCAFVITRTQFKTRRQRVFQQNIFA